MEFVTNRLTAYENLTFDLELKEGSFVVPEPNRNYAFIITIVGLLAICSTAFGMAMRNFLKTREKIRYYKGLFVKPEYQPHEKYSLPEMVEVYIGKKKDTKVAMLLEMVVERKIEFKKTQRRKWSIIIKDLDGVRDEYLRLLVILNGGAVVAEGDEIELKRRTATRELISLKDAMEKKIVNNLEKDKLVEDGYWYMKKPQNGALNGIISVMFVAITLSITMSMFGLFIMEILDGILDYGGRNGGVMVFEEYFYQTAFLMIAATTITCTILTSVSQKYKRRTKEGLLASRYMDGLKLYIGMAEAERIKMLQSVKGADTSAEGIVKLYEKLLPYAAVFGLEESWMEEMKAYCKIKEIAEPDYLMAGIATGEISRTIRTVSSIADTSTTMSSSGGGSSSGSSGGGGGGFSGGGGGGGGFGGR